MKLIIRGQVSGLSGHYYLDTRCLKIGQIVRISDIRYYPATILYIEYRNSSSSTKGIKGIFSFLRIYLLGNKRGLGAKSIRRLENSISEEERGENFTHLFVEDGLESELVGGAGTDVDGVLEGEGGVVVREEVADGRVVPPDDY